MEEATELSDYLPISFKTAAEQAYIKFLWEAFETNYVNEKFQFAFLAYHMLTMCFVYFNVWQIKQSAPADFANALIGFNKDTEKALLDASSPFAFSIINESMMLRFLKLIDCDNAKIGVYAKLVRDRNESAHPNGNIFFSDQGLLDSKLREVLRIAEEIQIHSRTLIEHCYQSYLLESYDPDEREYADNEDQNREVLVHGNYLSKKDIEVCMALNLTEHADHPAYQSILALHNALKLTYSDSE
jgi:hypothetical protein